MAKTNNVLKLDSAPVETTAATQMTEPRVETEQVTVSIPADFFTAYGHSVSLKHLTNDSYLFLLGWAYRETVSNAKSSAKALGKDEEEIAAAIAARLEKLCDGSLYRKDRAGRAVARQTDAERMLYEMALPMARAVRLKGKQSWPKKAAEQAVIVMAWLTDSPMGKQFAKAKAAEIATLLAMADDVDIEVAE